MDSFHVDSKLWKRLFVLYKLAEMGARYRTVKVSTDFLGEKMGTSQQTASRQLIWLDKQGLIIRTVVPEGCLIKISDLGVATLKRLYSTLRLAMEVKRPLSITLEGILFTGFGEGAYYVSRDGYRKQFLEKLGFTPYPGTLNMKLVSDYDAKSFSELLTYPAIEIDGFTSETRSFGPVKCYPATVNNKVKGALISAIRTHYNSSVVEIIAPVFIRGKLKLKDGNKLKVEILTLP